MCAGREGESATGRISGGRASDRATTPGKEILKQESSDNNLLMLGLISEYVNLFFDARY